MTPITPAKELIAHLTIEDMLELNTFLIGRIKAKQDEEGRQMKRQLFVGSKVSFRDNDGRMAEGKVTKIMRKFAKVDTGDSIWRVPINLLNKMAV